MVAFITISIRSRHRKQFQLSTIKLQIQNIERHQKISKTDFFTSNNDDSIEPAERKKEREDGRKAHREEKQNEKRTTESHR